MTNISKKIKKDLKCFAMNVESNEEEIFRVISQSRRFISNLIVKSKYRDGYVNVFIKCPFCGKLTKVSFLANDFYYYFNGAIEINHVKNLSIDEREVLISGICFDCQKTVFI